MQLLHSNPVTNTEFCSLSLLIDTTSLEVSDGSIDEYIDLAIVTSPVATIAPIVASRTLSELHDKLSRLIGGKSNINLSSSTTAESPSSSFLVDCLEEEKAFHDTNLVQSFRPTHSTAGMILYYIIIDDSDVVQQLLSLTSPSASDPTQTSKLIAPVLAATVCVGVTGMPYSYAACPCMSSLTERLGDCRETLRMKDFWAKEEPMQDIELILLSVLMDDEHLKTNEMVELEKGMFSQTSGYLFDESGNKNEKTKLSQIRQRNKKFSFTDLRRKKNKSTSDSLKDATFGSTEIISSSATSSEMARIFDEQMQILSLAETDMIVPPYQERMKRQQVEAKRRESLNSPQRSSRRSGRFDSGALSGSDLAAFEYVPPGPRIDGTSTFSTPNSQSASTASDFTVSTAFTSDSSSVGSIPMLSGPIRDSSSQKAQMRRNKVMAASMAHQRSKAWNNVVLNPRAPKQDKPIEKTKAMETNFVESSVFSPGGGFDETTPINHTMTNFDNSFREELKENEVTYQDTGGSTLEPRTQVNIAMNEDLACSYKMSKMVSCIVEGVVQVQVTKSDESSNIAPFVIRVKDPSKHINTLVENSEYAENVSLDSEISDKEHIREYLITVSNSDNYFPIFKYKVAKQVRPIPIRVQSKVRFNDDKCRVALQISSNPSNEKTLTDLTIVMAVPHELKGETLVTQPPGGIFDPDKQNVIWFVAELGQGEKFQLQAQFDKGSFDTPEPSFPVLVRCQAMYTQFSNIDFDVRSTTNAETLMISKISKRVRLSHKER